MTVPLTLALAADEDPLSPSVDEPWVTPAQLTGCASSDQVDLTSVCQVATKILYLLSGRRFGVRTETVRPRAGQREVGWGNIAESYAGGGGSGDWLYQWQNNDNGQSWLMLKGPVQNIQEVKIDGNDLDPSEYALYDGRRLVRIPQNPTYVNGWPVYQRIDLPDDQIGTFSITYQWGTQVPPDGQVAAASFACQLAKYFNHDGDCALPDRVISVTRQGVSQTLLDPSQFIKEARTGLYLVDLWLGAVNPNGNRRRPTITSPDDIELLRSTP